MFPARARAAMASATYRQADASDPAAAAVTIRHQRLGVEQAGDPGADPHRSVRTSAGFWSRLWPSRSGDALLALGTGLDQRHLFGHSPAVDDVHRPSAAWVHRSRPGIGSASAARQGCAWKGSAKYWVSWVTKPSVNSMTLSG